MNSVPLGLGGSEKKKAETARRNLSSHSEHLKESPTREISGMSFSENRIPTSYTELDGVELKIAEKYRCLNINLQEVGMASLILKDTSGLDKYQYDFEVEHQVLETFGSSLENQKTAA